MSLTFDELNEIYELNELDKINLFNFIYTMNGKHERKYIFFKENDYIMCQNKILKVIEVHNVYYKSIDETKISVILEQIICKKFNDVIKINNVNI
jgi:hypothetical protein